MPIRMSDRERIALFNRIMQVAEKDDIPVKYSCIRFGLTPTSFPNFKQTIKRILQRTPELRYEIDEEFRSAVWK